MDDNNSNLRKRKDIKDLKEDLKENIKENVASSFESVSNKIKEKSRKVQEQFEEKKNEILSEENVRNMNWPAFIYGVICYSVFTWTFIHLVLWLSNSSLLSKTIDFDFTTKTSTITTPRFFLSYIPFVKGLFNSPFISWFTKLRIFSWIMKLPVFSWVLTPFFTSTTTTIPSIFTETFWTKLFIDVGLFSLFALHHTLMLNRSIDRNLKKFLPEPIIHVTNVLIASSLLSLLFYQWRPLTTVSPIAYSGAASSIPGSATTATVTPPVGNYGYPIGAQYVNTVYTWPSNHYILREVLNYGFYFGIAIIASAAFIWDQLDLLGMTRFWHYVTGRNYENFEFKVAGIYKYMSHPIMTGMLLSFWCAPIMSYSRFLLCIMSTAFIIYGVAVESKHLGLKFGPSYQEYSKSTPRFIPRLNIASRRPMVQERGKKQTLEIPRDHMESTASA